MTTAKAALIVAEMVTTAGAVMVMDTGITPAMNTTITAMAVTGIERC
jgi:hypothetical protein